jgi:hypothetical protein
MFLALYVTVAVCSTNLVATIRIANNNPNRPSGPLVYSTLQAAITSAVAGDTIYIIPTGTSYGDVSIAKKLTLFGIGYSPNKDIALTSRVGTITITSDLASGTKISGLVMTKLSINAGAAVSDLVIERNDLFVEIRSEVRNLLINNNYLRGTNVFSNVPILGCIINHNVITSQLFLTNGSNGVNILVANNVFVRSSLQASNGTIISNNIFSEATGQSGSAFYILTDCLVSNNVFYGTAPRNYSINGTYYSFERNVFNNNISFGTADNTLPPSGAGVGVGNTGSGNLVGVDPQFTSYPGSGSNTFSLTYDFHLQPTSPGKNAGTDGTDIGIYGGGSPWVFSPTGSTLPVVQSLNVSSVIKVGDSLKVQIKAKGY